jgi:hypothetical protein
VKGNSAENRRGGAHPRRPLRNHATTQVPNHSTARVPPRSSQEKRVDGETGDGRKVVGVIMPVRK